MNLINDSHESIDHEAEAESLGFNKVASIEQTT